MKNINAKLYHLSKRYNIDLPFYKHFFISKNELKMKYDNIKSLSLTILNDCNLSCAYCDNFIPLRKKIFYETLDNFEKNLIQLKIFCNKIDFIFLVGGEPFLHPNIEQICIILRKYYPDSILGIHTNGCLLTNTISDNILDILAQLNITLSISVYPILSNDDRKIIYNRCDKHNIICHFRNKDTFSFTGLSTKKNHINNYYNKCQYAGFDNKGQRVVYRCTQLNPNGDLYFCALPANIHRLNEYFSLNYEVIENEDYINIYRIKNKNEILKLYNNATPFCRYCNEINKETKPWITSEKKLSEWVVMPKI